jgi:hypothetical protein
MNIRKTKGFYLHLTEHSVSNFKHLHCQLPKTMYYTFTVNFRKPCTKTSHEASKLLKSKRRVNLRMLHIQTVTYSKLAK